MRDSDQRKDNADSSKQIAGLPVVRHKVAGIDLGSERHWVCAATVEGSGREVADFGATTCELIRMAKWLNARKVESVAMESTGVYWIAPHEVLEAEGLEVMLVDTRQLARVPGRDKKSDPFDCEWIQRLHSCGLLMGSFRPKEAVCMLRTLVRDKGNLVAEDAEEPGPDERASAPGRIGHRRGNGNGHPAGDRRRRAGRAAVGEIAEPALPQERRGDCRAIERTLAGGSLVQPAAGIEDVRRHPGADHRV